MKFKSLLFCFLILLFSSFSFLVFRLHFVNAVDCPAGNQELYNICMELHQSREALHMSEEATKPLEATVANLENQINGIQNQIDAAERRMEVLEEDIFNREVDLGVQKELLASRVRSLYKKQHYSSPLLTLLSSQNASQLTKELFFKERVANQDQQIITQVASDIKQLKKDKEELAANKISLANYQKELDSQAAFFKKEIKGAKDYQASLTQKIAELTARQQAILAEKAGTFQTTVGDVPLADDPAARPDYDPGFRPAFAAFSFGAPHFKGLSQYGAFGRAKEGQSAEDILHAYYGSLEIKKDYPQNISINVQGFGSVDLETYVKRIYEMPSSWGDEGGFEALKAQAVAARSYALAYTNNGLGSICATEQCQVYKPANKGGKWEEAVNATAGWVLIANGSPFSAWYASTSGGYQESYTAQGHSTPGFWDTKNGRDGWTSQAYEKIAGSPWFYKGWYKTRSGDTCGRSHPWLNDEEMADILNAWVILQAGSDDRVSPLGSCWGGNPYSISELRDQANQKGGSITSVSAVSVEYSEAGFTANVRFSTNRGEISLSGADFKKIFNLRAPGRIALKSGLFNIEKK